MLTLTEAWRNVMAHKLRSWLSVLSILIGTASLGCMLSMGQSAKNKILSEFEHLGTDLMAIHLFSDSQNSPEANSLTRAQWQALRQTGTDMLSLAPYGVISLSVSWGGHSIDQVNLVYSDAALFKLLPIHVTIGRLLSPLDRDQSFVLVGFKLAQQWTSTPTALIGQPLHIHNVFFTIVGVLAPWLGHPFFSTDVDHSIIILNPATEALAMPVDFNHALLRVTANANLDHVQQYLQEYLWRVNPHERIQLSSAKALQQSLLHQKHALSVLLGASGGLILLAGGLGIMNILLVSVSERKKEIGLRLSLGATGRHIQTLFLSEAAILGAIGGIMGGFLGELSAYLIGRVNDWPYVFHGASVLASISIAITTCLFFGVYPAYQASRLHPIDALRGES